MSGHAGRCFRARRRTKLRLAAQGREWVGPTRIKVPVILRGFTGGSKRVTRDTLQRIIAHYAAAQMARRAVIDKGRLVAL